jgi:group I intron endonuclease
MNKNNGKIYIGSAITNRINTRFRNHCIHLTGSKPIKDAINKYGLKDFNFRILSWYNKKRKFK